MANTYKHDLFVIGAGPGGYYAAISAAKKGMNVGIAEGNRLGGTCTNTGCIPTKTYLESVNLNNLFGKARRFGIEAQKTCIDLSSLYKRKKRIVDRLIKGIEYLLRQNNVTIYPSNAVFTGPNTIDIGGKIVEASNIIIASGSRPKRPAMLDVQGIWTSDEIFNATQLPESLIIIGGGAIGVEMAYVFEGLGTRVTVIEAMDRILPLEDEIVSGEIIRLNRKISFISNARITKIQGDSPYKVSVSTHGGQEHIEAQNILLSIGREPVVPHGLDKTGIHLNPSGGIDVDDTMQSSTPGLYAIGDVTAEHMYAYTATKEAGVAVKNITGEHQSIDYSNIPSVIFTKPEIASVGKRLEEMDMSSLKQGSFPVSALSRARTMEENDGFANIYCSESGTIERVTIMAPHATELICWAGLAIRQGLTVEELLNAHVPHPTVAEIIKEASEDLLGMCVHK